MKLDTAIIAMCFLIVILYILARLSGVLDTPDDDDYIVFDDDVYDDAVPLEDEVVAYSPDEYGPDTLEFADLALRLTKPHVFADDWYLTARREFSEWAAEQYQLQAEHRRELLGAG